MACLGRKLWMKISQRFFHTLILGARGGGVAGHFVGQALVVVNLVVYS